MRKLLSVLLAFAMIFSSVGITVFAADETTVAKVDGEGFPTLDAAFAAATDGQTVEITSAGTYNLPSIKSDITIKAAEGNEVVFDNIGEYNTNSSNVTFENITFDYYPNVDYTGLQHSGNLIYNNCTIDGQVFLYGTSETFNNCVFNQNSSDAYNVWTYGANEVEFNKCTFNSAGKSVLIYKEGNDATFTTSVNVVDTDFFASAAVDGKAAIEMDSSLIAGIKLTIDADTTATGFGIGSVSGNSLWNNKKGNSTEANNDITVVVNSETVLEPIYLAKTYKVATKEQLVAAIASAVDGDTITLAADIAYGTDHLAIEKAITLNLGGKTLTTNARNYGIALKNDNAVVTNGTLNHAGTVAAIKVWNAKEISYLNIDVTGTSASGNAIDGIVIQENSAGVDTIKNVNIYSTSGQGVAVGIKTYKCGNASENVIGSMEKVDIDAKNAGMFISAPCGTATNCEIKGAVTGIEMALEGTYNATLKIVNCSVEGGTQALYVHDEQKGYEYEGKITLTADESTILKSNGATLTYAVTDENDVELSSNISDYLPKDVAEVGAERFTSIQAALDAAETMEGDITITLLDDVEWETGAEHGSTPLISENATATSITIDGQNKYSFTATGAGVGPVRSADAETKLVLKNLTINDESVSYAEDAWEFTYLEMGGNLKAENCKFTSGIIIENDAVAEFVDCSFQPKSGTTNEYSVWVDDGSVKLTGCKFTGARAVKIHEDYGSEITDVTIEKCTFDDITAKPGIVIGDLNAATTLTVKETTMNDVKAGDQGMYLYESDTDISVFDFYVDSKTVVYENDVQVYPKEPVSKGTFKGGMVNVENPDKTFITADIVDLYATESVLLKLYDADDTLLATTVMSDQYLGTEQSLLSVKFCILGTSGSWTTTWENDKLRADYVPAYATLHVDGVEMNSANIKMITTNGELPIVWGDVPGVAAVPEEKSGFLRSFWIENMPIITVQDSNGNAVECYQLGLFAGIDSTNYQTAGFDLSFGDNTGNLKTKSLYTSITGTNATVTAEQLGKGAWRIFGKIAWIPTSKFNPETDKIFFTPYVINMDGSKTEGETRNLDSFRYQKGETE
ncbi:MAG: hypothetical protein UIM24_04040 [Clostridia bacterium]|nr:hypothetical protein [Clostridia bacterium]